MDMRSPFRNGYWQWDEVQNSLLYISREINLKAPSLQSVMVASKSQKQSMSNELKFRETVDNLEQVRFRRYFQRRCRPNEPKVVTIQDIKDIVLFIANMKDLTPEFIKFFHIATMDRFLRALIVYFQYYIQIWDNLNEKREDSKRKLNNPGAVARDNIIRDDLADLRAMVAREYCTMLYGARDTKKFHHMSNKNNVSMSEKDRKQFEIMVCIAVRVVWVALQRKNLSLIELELNRLLRTDIFNIIIHRGIRGGADLCISPEEKKLLGGLADIEERKLFHRSPITKELILGDHDYRMLITGTRNFHPRDERLTYLEIAISAPEELLIEKGVTVGMLGILREDYDAMLMNMERSAKQKYSGKERIYPKFQLPPKTYQSDSKIAKSFPNEPSIYQETPQKLRGRKLQCKMWQKAIEKSYQGRELSILDLSVSQSHVLLMSSKSSISLSGKKDSVVL